MMVVHARCVYVVWVKLKDVEHVFDFFLYYIHISKEIF